MSGDKKSSGSSQKPIKEYFIDEKHDDYKNCQLKAIDAKFEGNQADIEAFFRLYSLIVNPKLHNFTVQKAIESSYELAERVNQRVRGVDTCSIKFEKGTEGKDSGTMKFAVS